MELSTHSPQHLHMGDTCLKPTRKLTGLGPLWVFTAHEEQRDRQSAAAQGRKRRQAASSSLQHAILSLFLLLWREKEEGWNLGSPACSRVCPMPVKSSHHLLSDKLSRQTSPLPLTERRGRTYGAPRAQVQGGK